MHLGLFICFLSEHDMSQGESKHAKLQNYVFSRMP